MDVETAQIGGRLVDHEQLAVVAQVERPWIPPRPGAAPLQAHAGIVQQGQTRGVETSQRTGRIEPQRRLDARARCIAKRADETRSHFVASMAS